MTKEDEIEKMKQEVNELKEQVRVEKAIDKMVDESLDRPHPVFNQLTQREVIEMMGESAFHVSEEEIIPMSDEAVKDMAKKYFRVDLDETR